MNRFLQMFLQDAQRSLEFMRGEARRLREENDFSPMTARQIIKNLFQSMLKGSAAAFELETISELAHELENLLERLRFAEDINHQIVAAFEFGLEELEQAIAAIRQNNSYQQTGKLPQLINGLPPSMAQNGKPACLSDFPLEVRQKISQKEIENLLQTELSGASIFVIEVSFNIADFAKKLNNLRQILSESAEIIATLPGDAGGEIALKIVGGAKVDAERLQSVINPFGGKIVYISRQNSERRTFADACEIAVRAGATAAKNCGKQIRFEITGETVELTAEQVKALSTAFLHLARNAVAHGIETPEIRKAKGKNECGLISLTAENQNGCPRVTFSDDGGGLDLEKLAAKASKLSGKQLVVGEITPSLINKILFSSAISTAESVSRLAGRGVGLDAVKDAIENIGGSIDVVSSSEFGTIFEINLPETDFNAETQRRGERKGVEE
jgi:chemotaxis protein histidine kinase CheA